jgi:hypothetical protein
MFQKEKKFKNIQEKDLIDLLLYNKFKLVFHNRIDEKIFRLSYEKVDFYVNIYKQKNNIFNSKLEVNWKNNINDNKFIATKKEREEILKNSLRILKFALKLEERSL